MRLPRVVGWTGRAKRAASTTIAPQCAVVNIAEAHLRPTRHALRYADNRPAAAAATAAAARGASGAEVCRVFWRRERLWRRVRAVTARVAAARAVRTAVLLPRGPCKGHACGAVEKRPNARSLCSSQPGVPAVIQCLASDSCVAGIMSVGCDPGHVWLGR